MRQPGRVGTGTMASGQRRGADAILDPSDETGLGAKVAKVPVRHRRGLLLGVPFVAAVFGGAVLYLQGGGRLTGAGGNVGAPVDIGAEFHTTVFLDTDDATVELVSARPVGASPQVQIDLSLVELSDGASGVGGARGPLDDRYRTVPLEGHHLRTSSPDDLHHQIDVRLVPTSEGIHQLRAIEVTYRAGFLRERTAVLDVRVCLAASEDWLTAWQADPEVDCPLPDG